MATGSIGRALDLATLPHLGASQVSSHPHHGQITVAYSGAQMRSGAQDATNLPSIPPSFAGTSVRIRTYYEDYYNRIYIVPPTLELGTITGDTTTEVLVWNTYRVDVELDAFSIPTSEISISGLVSGDVIKPMRVDPFLVQVDGEGQPTLDATIGFTFTNTEYKTLVVTGVRARLFDHKHNWQSPLEMEYAWLTEIITSRSGREQRRALRQRPRRSIGHTVLVTTDNRRKLARDIQSWHQRTFIYPDRTQYQRSTAELAQGSAILELDTVPYWVVPEAFIIMENNDAISQLSVASVSGTTVTLLSPSDKTFPSGTKVMPALTTRIAKEAELRQATNEAATAVIDLNVTPGTEIARVLPAPDVEYNGREVFLHKPDWAAPPSMNYQSALETLDYRIGKESYFSPVDFETRVQRATFRGMNAVKAKAIVDFLYRMRGRQREFYMPSWTNDIIVDADIPATSNFIRVVGGEYAQDFNGDTVNNNVYMLLQDGSYLLRNVRQVTEYVDGGVTYSSIEFVEEFDDPLTVADIKMVCWMPVWRLASDNVTVSWTLDNLASATLSMQALETLGGE